MIFIQKKETENLKEINNEMKEYYSNCDVNFNASYMAYDGKNEWVDPTTTKMVFDKILSCIEYSEDDSFIDCGSGLGHVLYLASFHFKKVFGIEILEDIAILSKKNLISLIGNEQFSKKIELYIGNILEQPDSFFEKGNIFYVASPFSEEKDFNLLIDKICKSIKRRERNVCVVYYYPYFKKVFENYSDCFELVTELSLIGDVVIYKHKSMFA